MPRDKRRQARCRNQDRFSELDRFQFSRVDKFIDLGPANSEHLSSDEDADAERRDARHCRWRHSLVRRLGPWCLLWRCQHRRSVRSCA